jgi:hypothetical protein
MGDRCQVWIKFGGQITRAQAEELVERLENYAFSPDWKFHLTTKRMDESIETLDEILWAEEVNYGCVDEVTDYCAEQGIAYEVWNGAGGDYGEGIARSLDGQYDSAACVEGMPLVPMADLLQAETLVSGFADVLKRARFMTGPFPNLVVK